MQPNRKFVYFTQWTDNKIRVIDVSTDNLAASDPIQHGTLTRQIHGVFFNPSGREALTTGYYFDINHVVLWKVDQRSGDLKMHKVIPLTVSEKNKEYAAFSHFVVWLDDRYAITSTQQTGPTSLTPTGFTVVGPSVWLVDAEEGRAKMIIGPAKSPDEPGIYKPASDVVVVGKKLYVGEEDSMDDQINADGYVSIWDLTDRNAPRFIKRLRPGKELPDDFTLTHELYPTSDGKYVYAQSWHSGHLVKINTSTDQVVKVTSKREAGWHMPHGNFVPGSIR
jgi:DNA-binding beta-propeller fold protein YncE